MKRAENDNSINNDKQKERRKEFTERTVKYMLKKTHKQADKHTKTLDLFVRVVSCRVVMIV